MTSDRIEYLLKRAYEDPMTPAELREFGATSEEVDQVLALINTDAEVVKSMSTPRKPADPIRAALDAQRQLIEEAERRAKGDHD